MSWDAYIKFSLPRGDPFTRAREVLSQESEHGSARASAMIASGTCAADRSFARWFAEDGQVFGVADLERLEASLPPDGVPSLELRRELLVRFQGQPPSELGCRSSVHCIGPEFQWPAIRHAEGLIYNPGDFKLYAPCLRGRAARLNIEALAREALVLSELGASSFRALDTERDRTPSSAWMVWHANSSGYSDDLKACGIERLSACTDDMLAEALLACDDLKFVEHGPNVVIFSPRGSQGNLSTLYSKLAEA